MRALPKWRYNPLSNKDWPDLVILIATGPVMSSTLFPLTYYIYITFIHLADAFIQSDFQKRALKSA